MQHVKTRKSSGKEGNPRRGYDFYGLDKQRIKELQSLCRAGIYPPEKLQEACDGFEWLAPWILLSVQRKLSYDHLEFDWKLGRIPAGRSDFYGYRRLFFYNLSRLEVS